KFRHRDAPAGSLRRYADLCRFAISPEDEADGDEQRARSGEFTVDPKHALRPGEIDGAVLGRRNDSAVAAFAQLRECRGINPDSVKFRRIPVGDRAAVDDLLP